MKYAKLLRFLSKKAAEPLESEVSKDLNSIKPDNIYTPKQTYVYGVKNKELGDKLYQQAMNARRKAITFHATKNDGSKVGSIEDANPETFLPVMPYLGSSPRWDRDNNYAKTLLDRINNGLYKKPVAEVTRRGLFIGPGYIKPLPNDLGPFTREKLQRQLPYVTSYNSPYSSALYTATDDVKKAFDDMSRGLKRATDYEYPGMLNALVPRYIKNPQAVKNHEIAHPASATAFRESQYPYIAPKWQIPGKDDLKNVRKGYGTLVDEATLAMHALKKAYANKYGKTLPSELDIDRIHKGQTTSFDAAISELRNKGWIRPDNSLDLNKFDGTGVDPIDMNIESLLESFFKREPYYPRLNRDDYRIAPRMIEQLRWYWPQANNIKPTKRNSNIQDTYVG